MKIIDLMSTPPVTCRVGDRLDVAAKQMWDHDVGIVPVTDDDGRLVGVVTDRDICMATFTRGQAPQAISLSQVMSRGLHAARANDSLEVAEKLMSEHRIRRLPIIDDDFHPLGVISVNDLARTVARSQSRGGEPRAFLDTLAAICEPRAESAPPFAALPQDPRRAVL